MTDLRNGADGVDTLHGVEDLRFEGGIDETVNLVAPNRAPVAGPVSAVGTEEQRLVLSPAIVLAAVSDLDGDSASLAAVANATGGRVWINLAGDIVFDPDPDFSGAGGFDYVVSDGRGGQATGRVTLDIAGTGDAPRLAGIFEDVEVDEDTPVDIAIPSGLFADADGDPLALTARLADGTALPSWLVLEQGRLAGNPPPDFSGALSIHIEASDGSAAATAQFTLTVRPVNDAPSVTASLSDLNVERGVAFEYVLPAGLFADADGDPLELVARLGDGSQLPPWLAFDGQRFTGTPPANFADELELRIFASDGQELAVATFALLAPSNGPPVAQVPLGNLTVEEDQPVSFTIPANAFGDPDGDLLALAVTHADGSPLPAWLTFDGTTLAGQPPANFHGGLALRVTASDGEFSASQTFGLTISPVNDAPQLAQPIEDVEGSEDNPVDFAIPQSTFADLDGDQLSLTAALVGGEPLPAWLSFSDGRFTGTPPSNFNGALDIEVSATDGEAVATDSFRLTIDPLNDPPVTVQPIPDMAASEGTSFHFAVPPQTFADVDGELLSYSAELANGAPLPSWLTFADGVFSGLPGYDFRGCLRHPSHRDRRPAVGERHLPAHGREHQPCAVGRK